MHARLTTDDQRVPAFARPAGLMLLALVGFTVALLLVRAVGAEGPSAPATESTRRMAERLARIADQANPIANPYLNTQRAELFRRHLESIRDPAERLTARVRLGRELLLAGQTLEAVRQLQQVQQAVAQYPDLYTPYFRRLLQDELAVAYLRLGEQENCIALHSAEACLMPIRGRGIHTVPRGSRMAAKAYAGLLAEDPTDLGARWLLNLAHMTLGQYPEQVPDTHRIPPAVFESEYPLPRFPDVAMHLGIDAVGLSGGSVMEDFDRDGFLDIMASSWGQRDQLRLFRNNGDGTFTERTAAAGLLGLTGGLNLVHADYDNDGFADVVVLRGAWLGEEGRHPNSLLHNNGDGTFTDVTEAAGLLTLHPTPTAAWADYDGDGWLDLYFGNESGNRSDLYDDAQSENPGVARPAGSNHPCQLFRNNGDGTFTDVAADVGVANVGFVKGLAWGDFNNDGRPDLFLSRMGEPNVLYRNDGGGEDGWRFTDVTATAGVSDPLFSFPTWFWDYDNDGWLDLFVAGYSVTTVGDIAAMYLKRPHAAVHARLFHNNGDGTFTDVTATAGCDTALLAMGANYGDLDNDGWLDFYIGNGSPHLGMLLPNRMYRNAGDGTFQDVTTAGGFGHLQKGHGVAFGDLDNDGDQDVYATMGGAYSGDVFANVLFLNPGNTNHWITLRFEGTRSNRAGVGARVQVGVTTPAGDRDIYMTVGTGGSFGSSSLQQEIGLGNATRIRRLRVEWPGAKEVQEFENVRLDQAYVVRQDQVTLEPLPLRRIDLATMLGGKATH